MTDLKENKVSPQIKKITSQSPWVTYREIFWGALSVPKIIAYEMYAMFFSSISGIFGLGVRAFLCPVFLKEAKSIGIGRGVSLRRPAQISFGRKNLIDDYASIEAKGEDAVINFGDACSIGKYSIITSKNGSIEIKNAVNISSHVRIATESKVSIGASTLIAAYAYIGPGNHQTSDSQYSLIESPMENKGGVVIGEHCWIGAHSTIMDGVTLGDNVIVGAHAFVNKSFPSGSVVVGVPAREIS